MDFTLHPLIKKAYATPSLRQHICNRGMISLYSDFSGHEELQDGGLACCSVYNRNIQVYARKIAFEQVGDSVYGELLAIRYSLELLEEALLEHRPKCAILYTDCSCIGRLLLQSHLTNPLYEEIRDHIQAALKALEIRFPNGEVRVKYIGKHKKDNALHRMAHIAARKVIGK